MSFKSLQMTPGLWKIKTGTPIIKVGQQYFVAGIGGAQLPKYGENVHAGYLNSANGNVSFHDLVTGTVYPVTSLKVVDTGLSEPKYAGTDITDATAQAGDIVEGKTAYIKSGKVTGTYVPSSGGGNFYKCSALVAASEGGVQGQTLRMQGTDSIGGGSKDITFTLEDATKTGKSRTWKSSDGEYRLLNKLDEDQDSGEYIWYIIHEYPGGATDNVWTSNNSPGSTSNDPWDIKSMMYVAGGMSYALTWTVSEASAATPASWSGYKATQGDDGKYSFADTATTGLSYDGGFTPQVGTIYTQDAKVKVAQLMEVTAAIPQDGLVFWMPFNGNTEPAVGAVAVVGSMGAITYNTKNGITYTVLPGTSGWRIYSSGTTDFSLGDSYSYICYYRDDSDHTKSRRFLLNMNLGSNYQNTYVPNSINKLTVCETQKESTSGQWHFLCIRSNGSTASIKGTIDTYTWTNSNAPGVYPARYDSFVAAPSDWATSSIGEHWQGGIFDFAIYNRILTDEEVTALYQRVIPLQS